jgi:negative regulator of sigma E activity
MLIELILAAALWPAECRSEPAARAPGAEDLLRLSLAPRREAYEGEAAVETRSIGKTETRTVRVAVSPPGFRREVFDESGRLRLLVVSDGAVEWIYDPVRKLAWKGEPADADYKLLDPDEEYGLLRRNYDFRVLGREAVAGRQGWVLEGVRRDSGRTAMKLWIDGNGFLLRREAFGRDGAAASSMRFSFLRPLAEKPEGFAFVPPAGVRQLSARWRPDFMDLQEASSASGLKPRLPRWLPQGFVLESVNVIPRKASPVLHIRFSDGAEAVSLFQYPAKSRLRLGYERLGSGRRVRVGKAWASLWAVPEGKILSWSAGERFVLVGSLSSASLRRMAESVPEEP